jgi:hypothetical protein
MFSFEAHGIAENMPQVREEKIHGRAFIPNYSQLRHRKHIFKATSQF